MVDFEHKKAADKLDFFLDLSIVVGFVGICKGWDSPLKFFFDWTNTSYLGYQEFLLETYCQDMNFGFILPTLLPDPMPNLAKAMLPSVYSMAISLSPLARASFSLWQTEFDYPFSTEVYFVY